MATSDDVFSLFRLDGKVAAVTGGSGVLGSAISCALAKAGAKVAVLERRLEKAEAFASEAGKTCGTIIGVHCNVVEKDSVERAAGQVLETFGKVDILINAAGGNKPQATTNAGQKFFDIPEDAFRSVFDLNLLGTLLPSQIFGRWMAEAGQGCMINIASMAGMRPLTRIPAYAAAKAAVSNFTQWLAVHMAQEYSPNIRVNAIAPGFFITDQNRFLLTDQATSGLTARGQAIISHTPAGRFGNPDDLIGTALWLCSPAAAFVTGIVVPVDGGFSAYSGV